MTTTPKIRCKMRLEVYAESTRPLLDYYGQQGMLAQIDGIGRPEEIEAADSHGARTVKRLTATDRLKDWQ